MIHSYVESLKAKWVVHNALSPHKMCLKKLIKSIDISLLLQKTKLIALPSRWFSNNRNT